MPARSLGPIAAATLAALALVAAACGGLGPDELPEAIGSKEREQITQTLEDFARGVNAQDPEAASLVILPVPEVDIEEWTRLTWQIGALWFDEIELVIEGLGPAQVNTDREVVEATVFLPPLDGAISTSWGATAGGSSPPYQTSRRRQTRARTTSSGR